jgi:hypothetical protein
VIYGNTFNYTATFFGNSAIFIRGEANETLAEYKSNDKYSFCMGISVQSNTFNYNFGCPKYGGPLISFQCAQNLTNVNPEGGSNIDLIYDDSSLPYETLQDLLHYDNSRVPSDTMTFLSKLGVTI